MTPSGRRTLRGLPPPLEVEMNAMHYDTNLMAPSAPVDSTIKVDAAHVEAIVARLREPLASAEENR